MASPGKPLELRELAKPVAADNQALIRIQACGVCRTDLHVFDGDLKNPCLPLILGHEIVGRVESVGSSVKHLKAGDRVGVPWLGTTCGDCTYCNSGRENLCDRAEFTGYQINGGYAEYTVADSRYCFNIPERYEDIEAAPLLCAGLIGYRSLAMTGPCRRLGLYGFGAAAHIVIQIAIHRNIEIYAFTRPGDGIAQEFALSMGASWAGDSDQTPPQMLDAAILFAPVGALVPLALRTTRKGGTVVCAGIHMSAIPTFPYALLWEERSLRSVANLCREDGENFFQIASEVPLKTNVHSYPLESANDALSDLRNGKINGATVLVVA